MVDADGLNLIAGLSDKDIEQWDREKNEYVLTPHMKEMSRLTGYTVQELKENRTALIKGFTGIRKVVCAMKDSRTYVAGNEKPVFVNTSGNSAMAKAGAGDVLAGLITGLMAQKMSGYEAAVLGVYLHGLAGDEARKKCGTYSVLAEDILSGIKSVLKNLEEQQQ